MDRYHPDAGLVAAIGVDAHEVACAWRRDGKGRSDGEVTEDEMAIEAVKSRVIEAAISDREHFNECESCQDGDTCEIGAEYVTRLAEAVDVLIMRTNNVSVRAAERENAALQRKAAAVAIDTAAIRQQAQIETDGMVASTGRERALPDAQPHIVTYFRECADRIALQPATLVERGEVIALCDALDAERERLAQARRTLMSIAALLREMPEARSAPDGTTWGPLAIVESALDAGGETQ